MLDDANHPISNHSPNYHLIKKHVSYTTHEGFAQTLVNIMLNDKNEYLFVRNYRGFWTLSRRTLKDDVHKDIFEGFVELIGDELGFRGISAESTKSTFYPLAYLFDVDRQTFDETRVKSEKKKFREMKGKVYHLLYIKYVGSEGLPFEHRKDINTIESYRWVSFEDGIKLLESNLKLPGVEISKATSEFHLNFFRKINQIYIDLERVRDI